MTWINAAEPTSWDLGSRSTFQRRLRQAQGEQEPLRRVARVRSMTEISNRHSTAFTSSHPPTQAYRAFLVARNGRISGMVPLWASSDEEARLLAHELVEEEDVVELWAGLHAIARFERQVSVRAGP